MMKSPSLSVKVCLSRQEECYRESSPHSLLSTACALPCSSSACSLSLASFSQLLYVYEGLEH